MIISNCPRCQEGFRVPLGKMPDDAYAMCPWCHETFPLAEVLNHLPPQLQILTADGEPITVMEPVATHTTAGIESLTGVGPGALDHLQGNENLAGADLANGNQWDPTALSFGDNNGQTDGGWNTSAATQTAPMSVSPRPNRRKKGGSGIRSMIQVVVGGLLSVPIALAILLAVGRAPDLGFWPFDGQARSIQELLSFFGDDETDVETGFRNFEGQQLDTSDFDEALKKTQDPEQAALDQLLTPEPPPRSNDQSIFAPSDLDQTTPTTQKESSSKRLTETTSDALKQQQSGIPPELPAAAAKQSVANQSGDSMPLELPGSANSQTTDENAGTSTTIIAASQTKPSLETSESEPASRQTQSIPAHVMVEVTAAIQAIEKLDRTDRESDTEHLAEAYERIAEACETAQKHPNALSALANSISQSNAMVQLQEAAVTWLDYPQRTTQGIVLIGKPGTTAKGQILTLETDHVLTMSGKLNLPLAEKVMVLGQITEDGNVIEINFTVPLP